MSVKVKSIIVSIILCVVIAGVGIGLYCAWPAITGTITDNKYYTSEDVQNAYDEGYQDGINNENELTAQVDYYKKLTDTYYASILEYQAQVKDFETLNANNQTTISNLENDKSELETTVSNLQSTVAENSATISENNLLISSLQSQVASLTASSEDNEREIASLESQISNLQTLNSQLQSTNESNLSTITVLNNQIVSLNAQIVDLTNQVQNNSGTVSSLTAKIAQLEESIAYYEQYIAQLENGDQVVATFEFDGSVYNVQILSKNGTASVTDPTSTDYVIFNGWTVNGEPVELSTYTISTNTKFVADVTYRYDVKFMVDDITHNSQIVTSGAYATLPTAPTKDGYDFDYWTTDGVTQVDPTTFAITQNTTFVAKFTQLFTVKFIVDDDIISTQSVRNGECPTDVSVDNLENVLFYGWLLNDDIVDVSTYKVYLDTIFIASYKRIGGTFTVQNWNGFSNLVGHHVWTDGENIYYSANGTYLLDETNSTWSNISLGSSVVGTYVWTDGENIYYSSASTQKVLNKETMTWEDKTWNGLSSFYGGNVWTDGENIYYSSGSTQKVLDKGTSTWRNKTWKGLSSFSANYVWNNGENIYYSQAENQYVLNKETSTWVEKNWNGLSSFSGMQIWTDGNLIYYSSGEEQYVLNEETSTWVEVVWNGLSSFSGQQIWTDGTHIYYSNYSNTGGSVQYVLNKVVA